MHATEIIGYTFASQIVCKQCLRKKAATVSEANGHNAEFTPLEDLLDRWAKIDGVDREDEDSFDSDDFPKVTFETGDAKHESCGTCYARLDGNVMCAKCAEYGIFYCRETVATCDHCGLRKDVFVEMDYSKDDNGVPVDTACLDCLSTGKHLKSAHPNGGA